MSTGTTQVTEINIPFPTSGDRHLRLTVGACRLKVRPGAGDAWVTGTYTDPTGALPPKITQDGGMARISQEYRWPETWGTITTPPRFDLTLGKAGAYTLTIEAGASETDLDLGGLPLTRLEVKQGAGKYSIGFSAPNPQVMSLFDLDAGAGDLALSGLANANFAEMSVDGGAAAYRFDFDGALQRNAHVKITTGVSSVEIRVPATTAVKITPESVLGGMDIGDGFMKREGAFWNEATLAGKAPVLTIRTSVALGSLRVRSV
jgi:hypothetical protein